MSTSRSVSASRSVPASPSVSNVVTDRTEAIPDGTEAPASATGRTRELLAGFWELEVSPAEDGGWERARAYLVSALPPIATTLGRGSRVDITAPLIRRARTNPETLGVEEEPFAWKPAFVRRSLGLAAIEACLAGRSETPAQSVSPVLAAAIAEWERTGWRTFHWEPWCARLSASARAVVLADAVTWATALWSSFEWAALPAGTRPGGSYVHWTCPGAPMVRLRARAEVRVPIANVRQGAEALVAVSGGVPGPGCVEDLAFLALVSGLGPPSGRVPVRVMGLWPDAGTHRTVEIDEAVLIDAASLAQRTLAAVARRN